MLCFSVSDHTRDLRRGINRSTPMSNQPEPGPLPLLLDADDDLIMHPLEQHLPIVRDLALFACCSERPYEGFHCVVFGVG